MGLRKVKTRDDVLVQLKKKHERSHQQLQMLKSILLNSPKSQRHNDQRKEIRTYTYVFRVARKNVIKNRC